MKKASPLQLHDTPLFSENRWFATLLGYTVLWLVDAAGMWLIFKLPSVLIAALHL